jgi:peptidyl-prolyl cis-trans isomerase D
MLQAMKDKLSGWITWIIVTIISLIFVFWGMQAHFAPTAPQAEAVVKIGDRVVTKQDVTNRVNRLRTQLEDQDLSENALRQRAVQSLVRQKVLVEGTKRLKAGISDKQAEQLIYDMPVFKTNGQFSMEKYQRLIKQSRIQTATLRKQMADQLMLRQIRFGLTNSIMVLPWEKKHFARLLTQTRQIRYAYIKTRPYRSEVDVQKSEMKNHYQSHKADYVRAPRVKLNYIKLDMDQLENRINLTQEDLLAHYKANKSGF